MKYLYHDRDKKNTVPFTKKYTVLMSEVLGLIFGVFLVFSQINMFYGLPILILLLFLFSQRVAFQRNDFLILFLIFLQLMWFSFMYMFFQVNFTHWIRHVAFFVIIFTIILSKVNWNFIHGICISMIMLLLLDFSFNLISILTGSDPFGRYITRRPDDILPRLGGLFGHSFYSLNIGFVGFVSGYIKRNKIVIILSISNIIMTGTYRAFILLLMLFAAFCFIKNGVRFFRIMSYSFLFAFSVFGVTLYSAAQNLNESNFFRVFAWTNSLQNILNNPLFGRQDFYSDEMESVSLESIENYGIAESTYLDIGVHYGVVPMIIFFVIMMILYWRSFKNYSSSNRIILISSFIIFTETFYGSIYGMPLTTMFFTLIIFSTNSNDI